MILRANTMAGLVDTLAAPLAPQIDDAIFAGCTDRDAAHGVVAETILESRITGFAIGLLGGLFLGAVGAAYVHGRYLGGR